MKQFLTRAGARIAASLLLAVGFVLIARGLGVEELGPFATVMAVGYLASALLGFGASIRMLRIGAEGDPSLAPRLLSLRLLGAMTATAGTATCGLSIGADPSIIAMATFLTTSDNLVEFLQMSLAGFERQAASAAVCVGQRLVFCVLALGVVVGEGAGRVIFSLGHVLLLLLGALWLVRICGGLRKPGWHLLREQSGYWVSGFASNINQLEVPAVSAATSRGDVVAGYAVASRLINPLTLVAGVFQVVVVPRLARSTSRQEFQRAASRSILGAVAYAASLAAASPIIAHVYLTALGDDYSAFTGLIVAFVCASSLSVISQVLQAIQLSLGCVSVPATVIIVCSVAGVLGLYVVAALSPGAVWTVPVSTQVAILVGMAWAFQRSVKGASGIEHWNRPDLVER